MAFSKRYTFSYFYIQCTVNENRIFFSIVRGKQPSQILDPIQLSPNDVARSYCHILKKPRSWIWGFGWIHGNDMYRLQDILCLHIYPSTSCRCLSNLFPQSFGNKMVTFFRIQSECVSTIKLALLVMKTFLVLGWCISNIYRWVLGWNRVLTLLS